MDKKLQEEFYVWLSGKNIDPGDKIVPLLKETWNISLTLACKHFGETEGTDYGAEEKYHVE